MARRALLALLLVAVHSATAFVSQTMIRPEVAVRPLVKPMMMSATKVCNVKLVVKEGEAIDTVIMRFRREVNKSGHLRTLRNRRYFEDAREKKKRKFKEACMRKKFARNAQRNQQRFNTGM